MHTGDIRFCPRCRSVMMPAKAGDELVYRCLRCGYTERVPIRTQVSSVGKGAVTQTVIAEAIDVCPRCGSKLSYAISHNLFFRYCVNCGFITSEYRPPNYELPAKAEDVRVWLENERLIAQRNTRVIGYGRLVKVSGVRGDAHIKRVDLDVEVLSEYSTSLKPYDAVFYGNTMGVIVSFNANSEVNRCSSVRGDKCVDGLLRIYVQSNAKVKHVDLIKVAEPVLLYDSALRILGSLDCSLYGIIYGVNKCVGSNIAITYGKHDLNRY
ncbi:MAG: hypothetical protein ACP5NQ_07135, partial [Vulcanisaeta sp.]